MDYVLNRYTDVYSSKCKILHIAPEKPIENKIRMNKDADYITGDIREGVADYVVDVTNMPQFEDKTFDYVIMNHVLEHIPDEKKALSEIKRVLKDDGKFIFSFPIAIDEDTFESDEIDLSPSKKLELYGQEDHVRLYGKDAKERISSYGFKVEEYIVDDILDVLQIRDNHMISEDRMFIASSLGGKGC